jgi:hypothetical protein
MCVEQARMGIAYVNEQIRALTAGALLLLTLWIGGCATSTAGSSLMEARAAAAPAPHPKIMTADEWLKLKKELSATRRQAAAKAKQAVQPAQ